MNETTPRIPQERCGKEYTHEGHKWTPALFPRMERWCAGVPVPSAANEMESRRCVDFTAHIPHRWSPDRGLNYFKCPGLDAMTAALIAKDVADGRESDCGNFIHHPRHPWTETKNGHDNHYVCPGVPSTPPENFDRVVMRWPCDDRTVHDSHDYQRPSDGTWHHCPGIIGVSASCASDCVHHSVQCPKRQEHESHDWREDHLDPSSTVHCPGFGIGSIAVSEGSAQVIKVASPAGWKYHVEVLKETDWSNSAANMGEEVITYVVVRKGGAHPQHIAEYNNAVYARIVADALNGGALLGFEVEK